MRDRVGHVQVDLAVLRVRHEGIAGRVERDAGGARNVVVGAAVRVNCGQGFDTLK
jgi:hypothetical protein